MVACTRVMSWSATLLVLCSPLESYGQLFAVTFNSHTEFALRQRPSTASFLVVCCSLVCPASVQKCSELLSALLKARTCHLRIGHSLATHCHNLSTVDLCSHCKIGTRQCGYCMSLHSLVSLPCYLSQCCVTSSLHP